MNERYKLKNGVNPKRLKRYGFKKVFVHCSNPKERDYLFTVVSNNGDYLNIYCDCKLREVYVSAWEEHHERFLHGFIRNHLSHLIEKVEE